MAKQTLAARINEEDKDYLIEVAEINGVTVPILIENLVANMRDGDINYVSKKDGWKGFEVNQELNTDLDLTELYQIARQRRVTPQSILDNALRPYRV